MRANGGQQGVLHRPDATACNVVHGQDSLRSVAMDQIHIYGLAVLEAERHGPAAGRRERSTGPHVAPESLLSTVPCGAEGWGS